MSTPATEAAVHLKLFHMGGWVAPGMHHQMQRTDQGQDLEIPLGHHIVAPGHGVCVEHAHDRPFPNGFGDPYAVVRIDSGRFRGRTWYLGHANEDVVAVGHHFHTGDKLCKPNHSLNEGWGWIEIGEWGPNGPYGMGHGQLYHHLFTDVWLHTTH